LRDKSLTVDEQCHRRAVFIRNEMSVEVQTASAIYVIMPPRSVRVSCLPMSPHHPVDSLSLFPHSLGHGVMWIRDRHSTRMMILSYDGPILAVSTTLHLTCSSLSLSLSFAPRVTRPADRKVTGSRHLKYVYIYIRDTHPDVGRYTCVRACNGFPEMQ